ncbi:MAG: hypothetical protein U0133_01475 [Gemmatimonadales bacterium]
MSLVGGERGKLREWSQESRAGAPHLVTGAEELSGAVADRLLGRRESGVPTTITVSLPRM